MSDERMMIISSDGHTTAEMEDYTDYLDPAYREEFQEFCKQFAEVGSHNSEERTLSYRLDPERVDAWVKDIIEPGHLDGRWNPERRIEQLDRDGVSGEVLIPDFGTPFMLGSPPILKHLGLPSPDREHVEAANTAYNRWLLDFMSIAPERFAGMASIEFSDPDRIDYSIEQIKWAKESGLKGVMIPFFEDDMPLYDPVFERVWSALEDYELPANSHTSISGTSRNLSASITSSPHPACTVGIIMSQTEFFTRNILDHLVWAGVLDRHPRLQVVFTEQGSGWIPGKLKQMDYSYDGSYRRHDIRDVVSVRPSEYFARQCHIGSSLLCREEVANRHEIGVDKMMVGIDYPHHEGTWELGTKNYLQATMGAVGVPEDEALMMLASNAANVYGFDTTRLRPIADRIGPLPVEILTPPATDLYPKGDVHKPMVGALA